MRPRARGTRAPDARPPAPHPGPPGTEPGGPEPPRGVQDSMQDSDLSHSGTPRSRAELVERGTGHLLVPSTAIIDIVNMLRKSKVNRAVEG